MKYGASSSRYRIPAIAILVCGLLAVLLYACGDDAGENAPPVPDDRATQPGPAPPDTQPPSGLTTQAAGSGDTGVGEDSRTQFAEKTVAESAAPTRTRARPERKAFGKPGTQSRMRSGGASKSARDNKDKDGDAGVTAGASDSPAGVKTLPDVADSAVAARNRGAVKKKNPGAGDGHDEVASVLQHGGTEPLRNPNSELAGITPVPGYVRLQGHQAAVPSGARRAEAEKDSDGIVPGSSGDSGLPVPELALEIGGVKVFRFTWKEVVGATEYRLHEKISGSSRYRQVASLPPATLRHDLEVFLPRRAGARYILQACNASGCASSVAVRMEGSLAEAVGYIKASNTGSGDKFGHAVAISGDGRTLAVGAPDEDSAGAGVNGDQNNDSATGSGAVYLFHRGKRGWFQQAYIKAVSVRKGEEFGYALALSDNGNTLVVGAGRENSSPDRMKGDVDTAQPSGGVYIYERRGGAWTREASMKASNFADKDTADTFGGAVALSGDGNTLAIGADGESGDATGVNGAQNNGRAKSSGAVYVYRRGKGEWSLQAYVKASNTGAGDHFGRAVSLSGDGNTLAVGAVGEDSAASGINGNQHDDTAVSSGAVYVYTRSGGDWAQQAYVKASNNRPGDLLTADQFGGSVALSGDGATLAVGARFEDGTVAGVNSNPHAGSKHSSGAVYVYARRGGNWSQQAYVKASNIGWGDEFGGIVALSASGNTLAVGAAGEDSHAIGINGDEDNDMYKSTGAVYLYTRNGGKWVQRSYVKARNTMQSPRDPESAFGFTLALSDAGDILAVGAPREDGAATGVSGSPEDGFAGASGAVYLY